MKRIVLSILVVTLFLTTFSTTLAGPPKSNCQGGWCESGGGYMISSGQPIITKGKVYETRNVYTNGTAKTAPTHIQRAANYTGTTKANGWQPSGKIKVVKPFNSGVYVQQYSRRIK